MYIDSTFYSKLEELHKKKFNWQTNNCGFFVGRMLQFMYGKDFLREFIDKCNDKESSFALIEERGGWHNVLSSAGFSRRANNIMYPGDVVISENAIGISDGYKGLFAGGAFRSKEKITDVYYYTEK